MSANCPTCGRKLPAPRNRTKHPQLEKNRVVYIRYKCRDIGCGIESGGVAGAWTGEIDSFGKHTIQPVDGHGPRLYLFSDEIKRVEPYTGDQYREVDEVS